jgi:hypothetical protein
VPEVAGKLYFSSIFYFRERHLKTITHLIQLSHIYIYGFSSVTSDARQVVRTNFSNKIYIIADENMTMWQHDYKIGMKNQEDRAIFPD